MALHRAAAAIKGKIEQGQQAQLDNGLPAERLKNQLPSRVVPPATNTTRGGVMLASSAPQPNGTAASGTSADASRADHVHPRESVIVIWEQQSAGTDAGTFTSGGWQTRALTTEHLDTGGHASLASNQITLAAGTYRAQIRAPAFACGHHKARLRNTTANATILVGSNAAAPADTMSDSVIVGHFTLAVSSVLEVQHQCQTTKSTDGFGVAANFGEVEIYTVVELTREP